MKELAEENYRRKPSIQQRFHSEEHFLRLLPMPDKLSGVCHLATGTGKSYIMFGIAYLSLLLGKTKRVLVLGPASTIIEQGLRDKFKAYLYGEEGNRLKQFLPAELRYKTFKLLTCNDPIEDGSIVIENINAVYYQERNSLGDTLFLGNDEVLVLSDEVHHAYTHLSFSGEAVTYDFDEGQEGSGEDRDERLWMKFLREEKRIQWHLGFTGTPYNHDYYFVDVLYTYSINDSIEEKFIKRINPIIKTESDEGDVPLTLYQKFEQILETHADSRVKYSYKRNGTRQVKPITVFINPTQATAQRNTEAFIQVLADYMQSQASYSKQTPRAALEERARAQVICVISKAGDAETLQKLAQIEEVDPEKPGGQVEFIFAVNKLSEGWDVENVFQIVPMEERIFNSKLLISQVLGRGLRLPRKVAWADIQQNYPVVTITNHERFARRITELLDQVTECETRFSSRPIKETEQERNQYHFHLFNLEYVPHQRIVERDPKEMEPSISKTLILHPSLNKLGLKVTYLEGTKRFELTKEYVTFDQMVLDIERRFSNWTFEHTHFDFGDGQVVDDVPGRKDIEQVIRTAMNEAGIESDQLSLDNKKQIELFFNQYLPKGRKKVERSLMAGEPFGIATQSMRESSVRSGGLDQEASLFISEDYETELDESNRFVLNEVLKQDRQLELDQQWLTYQESYNKDYIRQLCSFKNLYAVNTSLFRSPQELVILSHTPEREFLFRLIEHGKLFDGWIKAPDTDFYSIDYEYWKKGRDRVRRSFNPDFFVRINLDRYLSTLGN
ncbi:MAG: DEAD/DEAH box helicase family protein, partial [Acidobacteriota bacterium]